MDTVHFGLIELAMTFGGLLVFAWWQLRDLKKYKTGEKSDEKDRMKWIGRKD